ncbi:MAG TPA: FIST N-terminal domain-containing protein, partial [Flavisolibacter sp.]|nr:FIST N-terminal domain-containing protein [Flavisolibacter sp.]
MIAKTLKGQNLNEIATALNQLVTDDFQPSVAIVFISVKQDREAICKLLSDKNITIFGATSSGEFIDGEIEEESIVIMLLDLNKEHFKVSLKETGDGTTREAGKQIGLVGKETFAKPAFIVASGGVSADGEMVVRGIEDAIGEGVTIFGGLAGDDLNMTATYVFTNNKATDNGVVAIIIDEEKVSIKGIATSGWKPVGTVRTVTKSEGNIVYTIDDQPALDI